jgi:hypothetical protein
MHVLKARRERKNQARLVMFAPEEKQHPTEPIDQADDCSGGPEHRLRYAQHHSKGIHRGCPLPAPLSSSRYFRTTSDLGKRERQYIPLRYRGERQSAAGAAVLGGCSANEQKSEAVKPS